MQSLELVFKEAEFRHYHIKDTDSLWFWYVGENVLSELVYGLDKNIYFNKKNNIFNVNKRMIALYLREFFTSVAVLENILKEKNISLSYQKGLQAHFKNLKALKGHIIEKQSVAFKTDYDEEKKFFTKKIFDFVFKDKKTFYAYILYICIAENGDFAFSFKNDLCFLSKFNFEIRTFYDESTKTFKFHLFMEREKC